MKKRFFIAGLALLLAGGIAFVVGMSTLGWNFALLDSEVYTAKVFELENSPESLEEVDVDVRNANIHVKIGDSVKIEYEESDRVKYSVVYDETKKTLVMEEERSAPVLFQMFNFHSQVITLTVPKVRKLSLESTNGVIAVPEGNYEEVDIETTNGLVTVSDITATKGVVASTTNSQITLSNIATENGNVTASSTNGKIILDDIRADSISAHTTNGAVVGERLAVNSLSCTTTNGALSFYELEVGQKVLFKSTNGNIVAEFNGKMSDFTIEGHTTNGSFIPGNTGTGNIKAECYTTNGDIRLSFDNGGHENDYE